MQLIKYEELSPTAQGELPLQPYDWWGERSTPTALFYRCPEYFLVRFVDQADFQIFLEDNVVRARPVPGVVRKNCQTIFQNTVLPLIANFRGGLNLHACAVSIRGTGVAFVGSSGLGKSTLAASFAKSGHPFLTEDNLSLEREGTIYYVRPSHPVLRLFDDSARALGLIEAVPDAPNHHTKEQFETSSAVLHSTRPVRLDRIYLLRNEGVTDIRLAALSPNRALAELLQHSLILDAQHESRMRSHFERLVALVESVSAFSLDYPRQYEQLASLLTRITEHITEDMAVAK